MSYMNQLDNNSVYSAENDHQQVEAKPKKVVQYDDDGFEIVSTSPKKRFRKTQCVHAPNHTTDTMVQQVRSHWWMLWSLAQQET
mgnify:CR=1 FL=1